MSQFSNETLFQIVNAIPLAGWLLLVFAPKWAWTRRIIVFGVIAVLSVAYALLFPNTLGGSGDGMSLAGISAAFQNPKVALLGWVHYLAFDLFVGMWEVQDAQTHQISHWFVIPCLVGTFLAGPIGLLAYLVIRTIRTKQLSV
jgi:hypothetical protein